MAYASSSAYVPKNASTAQDLLRESQSQLVNGGSQKLFTNLSPTFTTLSGNTGSAISFTASNLTNGGFIST